MSNLIEHAKSELERAGQFSEKGDFYGGMMGETVMKMIELFSEEEHSGMSASVAIGLFERLARFEPITPLTGEDDEWNDVGDGVYQNRRCSHVFKDETGVYDSTGIIFREPDGCCFTSSGSRVFITFPYTPTTEYRDVPKDR